MLLAEPIPSALATRLTPRHRRGHRRRLQPGWPLWAALVLYPLWWALGLGSFDFIIFAIPMGIFLLRRRPLAMPPGFGIWLLFLLWNVLSLVMIPVHAPNTSEGSLSGRTISLVLRDLELVAATIFLLYIVNHRTSELRQRTVIRWMAYLFVVTVGGGLLALAAPHFGFTAPLEYVLPHSIRANPYVNSLVHPASAQVQDVLGFESPRPAAPWSYTNSWGNNLSILLIWFCAYRWEPRIFKRHVRMALVLAVALIPIVYSLNRGLWLGTVVSIAFVIVQLGKSGDARTTMISLGAIVVGVVLFLATPLNGVVQQRANHGKSNSIRANVDSQSFKGALESPLIGWGDSRKVIGSSQSIAVGPSPQCPLCGAVNLGSAGEIWLVMFNQGLVGVAFYVGFFAAVWWRLRPCAGMIAAGGRLAIILTVFYTFFYNNLPTSLMLSMISIGIACRELPPWTRERASAPAFATAA